jgi:pyruvate dehydrogenase E2 component (dihydrolipoamide acetyltransferase)
MQSITLPELAGGLTAATVVRWLKQPGDGFSTGEALVELETENALVHLEASQSGTLTRVVAKPLETVKVGAELAQVEAVSVGARQAQVEAISAPAPQSKPETTVTQQPSQTSGTPENVVPILMPQAGNTMEEGIVVSWKVAEGDQIEVGQIICEIETDKATIEHESPEAGRLARIVAQEDETVPIMQPIALLADNDADADAYLAAKGAAGAVVAAPSAGATADSSAKGVAARVEARVSAGPSPVTAEGRIKVSPAARGIARERGIDLASLGSGSGPGGRILSSDVEKAKVGAIVSADGKSTRRPMPKMRRAIGLNLQRSKQTIPHFYLRLTIDAGPLFAFYREQKPGTNCTLNDCVVLAVGRAMAESPAVRSQTDGDEIVEYPHANIGIAVGVDDGLTVPVVLNVDTLTLAQLAVEAKRVVENARKGKLENIGQGNFTITNLGMFGIEEFSAIINPPESGILAVSAVRETVLVENGTMRPARVMTVTLSADHRIVDGLVAAKFLARLKEILENPSEELTRAEDQ